MLNNSWFKKEKPILGVTGFGGGAASLFRAGGATPMEATGGNYVLTPGNGYKYHTSVSYTHLTLPTTPYV